MHEIFNAEDGDHARVAAKAFQIDYGTKFPKAAAKITDDLDVLLEFYNYPADHGVHLRTTNPIGYLERVDDQACDLRVWVVDGVR